MAFNREYKALRVFDGLDAPYQQSMVHFNWYSKQLAEFIAPGEIDPLINDFVQREFILIKDEHKSIIITQKGKEHLDNTYFKELAYDIVDKCLMTIRRHNAAINTDYRRYQRVQTLAEDILEQYNLVRYLHYDKRISMVQLLEEGHNVLDIGGIRRYLIEKNGIDEQDVEKVQRYLKENARDGRIEVHLAPVSSELDLALADLKDSLDYLENRGVIEQMTFLGDDFRGVAFLKGFSRPEQRSGYSTTINNFNGAMPGANFGHITGSSLDQEFTNVGNNLTAAETEVANNLANAQLADIRTNALYRSRTFIVTAIALLLTAIGIWIALKK
jgi:hypothetical protein